MFKALFAAFLCLASAASAETSVDVASVAGAHTSIAAAQPRMAETPVRVDPYVRRSIAEWQRLRAGSGNLDDAIRFLDRHPDWPGLSLLRKRAEANMPIGGRAEDILRFFEVEAPQTGRGARALAAAHREQGNLDAAADLAVLTWRTMILTEEDEEE